MSDEREKIVLFTSKNAVRAARVWQALMSRQRDSNRYDAIRFWLETEGDRVAVLARIGIGMGDDKRGPAQMEQAAEFAAGYGEGNGMRRAD